jgi:glyoxylase-like metal-dependent hydrolase (beta-lactamase superfamily II)
MKTGFQNGRANVDVALTDGEKLPYCGGITVIHTPGHTLGHICLYLERTQTLVAGDELSVDNAGGLAPGLASNNFDTPMAIKSMKKLTQYDILTVICYHGGLFKDHCNERIAALAQG